MLIVSDINRETEEPLTGIDESKVALSEELGNSYTLTFDINEQETNQEAIELIQFENFITLEENGQTYRIKDINRSNRRHAEIKSVSADHVFFDLIAIKQDKSTALNGSKTFEVAMNYALKDTGWAWTIDDDSTFYALDYENFQGNALDLFNSLQSRHKFEWMPDSQTNVVHLAKRIGVDTDAQIRYKHNLINIKDDSTTSGITNIRKGYGKKKEFAEGQEPTVLKDSDYVTVVTWRHEESINRYGPRWGDDFENETFTQASSLLAAIEEDDKSKPMPQVSLSTSYANLEKYGTGVSIESTQLGNGLFVIHEPLDIDVQARILKRKYYPLSDVKMPELTIGNLKPSSVKQNTKARRFVASAEKRLTNNENAVRVASANVTKALNDLATTEGDLQNLSNLILQLQNAIADLETSIPPDVQYQLDALLVLIQALQTRTSDLEALTFTQSGLITSLTAQVTDLETSQAEQDTLLAGLQTQIDELKEV